MLLHLLKQWFLIDHRLLRVQDFAGPNTTDHLSNLRHFHICYASGVASAMASSGDTTGSMFFNQLCTQRRLQLCFRGTVGNLNIIKIAYIKQIYILAILYFLPRRGGHKTIQRGKKNSQPNTKYLLNDHEARNLSAAHLGGQDTTWKRQLFPQAPMENY